MISNNFSNIYLNKFSNNFIPDFNKSLNKNFYLQDTVKVARDLLGRILVRKISKNKFLAIEITETEAYLSKDDLSSHSAPGLTKRNSAMFENGGILYVYLIYGIHYCINIVTEPVGTGSAVLLRAGKPILGIEDLIKNRFRNSNKENIDIKEKDLINLCKGPANLAKSLDFTIKNNFSSLTNEDLFIQENTNSNNFEIGISKRIGITKSADLPLRFFIKN